MLMLAPVLLNTDIQMLSVDVDAAVPRTPL